MMQITEKCLPAVLELPYLEDLALAGLSIDEKGLMSVKQGCKSLQVLDMSNCQLTSDVGLSSLMTKASGLCQLRLAYNCMEIHSLDSSLQKLSKLQSIILDGCEVTTAGLKTIGNSCIPLRELSLRKCSGVTDEGLSSIVIRHKELAKLDLTCCHYITDVSLASITVSCTSLTTLRMESCILISNEGFHLIGQRCHHLKELDLTDNDLDDEGCPIIVSAM
ncbi:F-box/LRR-repeat protein 3-like [Canna indica]|uniref:F-box/LRR-repeat protein 3-like n=1 Tax=Canna indica TaxID=4628 RepID=A0AAQ3QRM3_9LILI|nr:F-box/LRR-repeat protein 3-like [Canna indica]